MLQNLSLFQVDEDFFAGCLSNRIMQSYLLLDIDPFNTQLYVSSIEPMGIQYRLYLSIIVLLEISSSYLSIKIYFLCFIWYLDVLLGKIQKKCLPNVQQWLN